MRKYERPTKEHPAPCSGGWYGLPKRKRLPCKKCGAEFGMTCRAERANPLRYESLDRERRA